MSRKAKTSLKLRVTLDAPPGHTIPMVVEYVRAALVQARDLRSNTDPMRQFDLDSIRVTLIERTTTYGD